MFHTHSWKEVLRSFNTSLLKEYSGGMSESLMRQLALGITVIELKCETCGDIKHIEVVGNLQKGATCTPSLSKP